jgi:hypothetical protein
MHAELDLYQALDELLEEFAGRVAAGSVMRWFARSVTELRAAGVDAGIAVAAQAMTRRRLRLHVPQLVPA